MELWVRSQEKDILLKVKSLLIDDDNYDIYTQDYVGQNLCTYTLGTYKSKERALQILDEIQNSILGILTLEDIEEQEVKEYTGKATFSKVTNQLVYIMPEE